MLGAAEGEYEFPAIRGALIKLFLDTRISQEKRSATDSKPTDRKLDDRFKNRFRKPRDGKTGRYAAHETDAHDGEEDPNSDEEESCEEESDLTTAFEREMDELASVVEELEDTLDVEDLRERSESMNEETPQRDTRKVERKRGIAVASLPRPPLLTQLSVHDMHP